MGDLSYHEVEKLQKRYNEVKAENEELKTKYNEVKAENEKSWKYYYEYRAEVESYIAQLTSNIRECDDSEERIKLIKKREIFIMIKRDITRPDESILKQVEKELELAREEYEEIQNIMIMNAVVCEV